MELNIRHDADFPPRLIVEDDRIKLECINEGGFNGTSVDLEDLLNWVENNIPDLRNNYDEYKKRIRKLDLERSLKTKQFVLKEWDEKYTDRENYKWTTDILKSHIKQLEKELKETF